MEDAKPNVTGAGTGEAKPESGTESAQINLKVRDADGNEVQFKVREAIVLFYEKQPGQSSDTFLSVLLTCLTFVSHLCRAMA
jgi:hypothetical protein